jgi:endo-1,4-beta-xylanase
MHVAGHTLFIAGVKSAKVDVFDMQGRPVFSGKCEKGAVDLNVAEGLYMVRVREGSRNLVQKIAIK